MIRVSKIAVVPAKRPAGESPQGARAGTHAAVCRGRDGSRFFATQPACAGCAARPGRHREGDDTMTKLIISILAAAIALSSVSFRRAESPQGARAGTHAAACRGRDGSRLFDGGGKGRDDELRQFYVPPNVSAS